jgi:hypothetical protein
LFYDKSVIQISKTTINNVLMGYEAIQIIIPDRDFIYVNNILKEVKVVWLVVYSL